MRLPGPGPHPGSMNKVKGPMTTLEFQPPEMHDDGIAYPASDIWSLGKTFMEVITVRKETSFSNERSAPQLCRSKSFNNIGDVASKGTEGSKEDFEEFEAECQEM